MLKNMIKMCVYVFIGVFLSFFPPAEAQTQSTQRIQFEMGSYAFVLQPHGMKVDCLWHNGDSYTLCESESDHFQSPQNIEDLQDGVRIFYPKENVKVEVTKRHDRLHFKITSQIEQKIVWPVLGTSKKSQAILYLAEGEGLRVPTDDVFWHKELNNVSYDTQGLKMSAPFWGYQFPEFTLNVIAHTDLRNTLNFKVHDHHLFNKFSHEYVKDNKFLEISFTIGQQHNLEPAWNYKRFLKERNAFKTLDQKIRDNPLIAKLKGAIHMYVWGDGRTKDFLDRLAELGIDNALIAYLEKPPHPTTGKWVKPQTYVDETYIKMAKTQGYLIAPYDSFHTMMPPEQVNCANVDFGKVYPMYCVRDHEKKIILGYNGRGCYASSEAFAKGANSKDLIRHRVKKFSRNGLVNSYFLDCDAMGEFFDDESQEHSMTQEKDRKNRFKRMAYIANSQGLVLGSETAASWAIENLAYTHGTFSVHNKNYPWLSDLSNYGGWWPEERPAIFFKQTTAHENYVKGRYNPAYRIPLYQAAFHESIISTDRWEIPHQKFTNCWNLREIMELLYGVPSIWALDKKDLRKYSSTLKRLYDFFHPLHQRIATLPMIDFQSLTEDRMVQSTTWGDQIKLIANFGEKTFEGIPSFGIKMIDLISNKIKLYETKI